MSDGASYRASSAKNAGASASGTASTSWRLPLVPNDDGQLGRVDDGGAGQRRAVGRRSVAGRAGVGGERRDDVDVDHVAGRDARRHQLGLDRDRHLDQAGLLRRTDRARGQQLAGRDAAGQLEVGRQLVVDGEVAGERVVVGEPHPLGDQVVGLDPLAGAEVGGRRPDLHGVVGRREHPRADDHGRRRPARRRSTAAGRASPDGARAAPAARRSPAAVPATADAAAVASPRFRATGSSCNAAS